MTSSLGSLLLPSVWWEERAYLRGDFPPVSCAVFGLALGKGFMSCLNLVKEKELPYLVVWGTLFKLYFNQ